MSDKLREMAQRGGQATAARGPAYYAAIGAKGGRTSGRRKKLVAEVDALLENRQPVPAPNYDND